ncbi:MAG: NAD(P)/FAD-dependent oxidoreductase [Methylobacter sp.]
MGNKPGCGWPYPNPLLYYLAYAVPLFDHTLEMTAWDAIIIGGGLAGGAAASVMAQAGRNVLVLEKESQAHHKVCGEFISPEAQCYLQELGIDLSALGAVEIEDISLMHGARFIKTRLPFTARSLSRAVLDEQVLLCAMQHGATLQRGSKVTGLQRVGNLWNIQLAGTGGSREVLNSSTVYLATGKHDLHAWGRTRSIHNDLIGLKMHFRLTRPPTADSWRDIGMILFNGGYAGLEKIEDDRVNFCLVITKQRFARLGHSFARLLATLKQNTPLLAERLEHAEACWEKPLAVFGIPYGFIYKEKSSTPGLYRIGDQMGVIPSFCGNGISIALHTAFTAAREYLHGGTSTQYHQSMRAELRPMLTPVALLSRLVVEPMAQPPLMALCDLFPQVIGKIITQTRVTKGFVSK